MRTALFVSLLVLVCSGCVTTGTKQIAHGQEILEKSRNVISSPLQLSYQDMMFGEPVRFTFDALSIVLDDGTRRRFVRGFKLPEKTGTYSVRITSFKVGSLYDPAIMYPEVQVLDKDYKVIRILPHKAFVFRSAVSHEGLYTEFFVNGNSHGERFLIIANRSMEDADLAVSQANITNTATVSVPVKGGFVMWFVPTGNNTPPIRMKASSTGSMEVEYTEYRPRKVGG